MEESKLNKPENGAPWLSGYGDVPFHLNYPDGSISDAIFATAEREGEFPALSYMKKNFSYNTLVDMIMNNEIIDGKTIAGVLKAQKYLE